MEFAREARECGIRALIDLVVNRASDQHPWSQSVRKSRTPKYRDYYVWMDQPSLPAYRTRRLLQVLSRSLKE